MRRSQTTYRPTVTPQRSTNVNSFTGYHLLKFLHGRPSVSAPQLSSREHIQSDVNNLLASNT